MAHGLIRTHQEDGVGFSVYGGYEKLFGSGDKWKVPVSSDDGWGKLDTTTGRAKSPHPGTNQWSAPNVPIQGSEYVGF